jgi:hypothetical protein
MQSGNFKEAWNRMKYLKKYGNYRAKQSIVIQNNINRILHRVTALMNTKQEKAHLSIIPDNEVCYPLIQHT